MFARRMATNFADYENVLKEGCPWVELRQVGGLPNVKWCEETLCSVVAEPANTWSNLAYLVVAVLIYLAARNESQRTLRRLLTLALKRSPATS